MRLGSWRGILLAVSLGAVSQAGAARLSDVIRISPSDAGAPLVRQGGADVAWGGGVYLVVWDDDRNGNTDIYAARVTPDGTVLDPGGIALTTAVNAQKNPAVAFDGTRFFVVWEDARVCCDDVYGARVDPDGTVLDPQGFLVSDAREVLTNGLVLNLEQHDLDVAAGGGYWVVTYAAADPLGDIFAVRLTPEGQVVDAKDLYLSKSSFNSERFPQLAFNGTEFLVVYSNYVGSRNDGRDYTEAARLEPDGTHEFLNHFWSSSQNASVASHGEDFLVVHRQGANLQTALLKADGTVREEGFAAEAEQSPWKSTAATFDGNYFLVAWAEGAAGDIRGVLLEPDGTPAGCDILELAMSGARETQPRLASDGTRHSLMVFIGDEPSGSGEEVVARVHARVLENDLQGDESCEPEVVPEEPQPQPHEDGCTATGGGGSFVLGALAVLALARRRQR
ncbi:MYXO-CTERM sorting domain-containing protein [Pyxidicoccus sp. MSG2]|uniref:MYXO-CTERM sorting domain-containing protein n=1 Tax=Pyxidicoccus sp. MSG2 TaxID=2996790 RepID=UPI0022709C5B|nr:MYXO-CTERM sorting domain-containing protein [Pyxidicoccus sp. MSG2]MCY1022017.1 MYXO-CTERM sorting domain-containing protein [Pyxidicoccus sp. MSG2]